MNKLIPPHQPLSEVVGLLDWLDHALSPQLGSIQKIETVKQRPWSQVYRIQAEWGIAYFKICGTDRQHEAELLQWMRPKYAAIMPDVITTGAQYCKCSGADR